MKRIIKWLVSFLCSLSLPLICITHTDRILMPAFGTVAVQGMLEDMRDICNQLLLKVGLPLYEPLVYLLNPLFNSGNGESTRLN
jgi:hypothetical protein